MYLKLNRKPNFDEKSLSKLFNFSWIGWVENWHYEIFVSKYLEKNLKNYLFSYFLPFLDIFFPCTINLPNVSCTPTTSKKFISDSNGIECTVIIHKMIID